MRVFKQSELNSFIVIAHSRPQHDFVALSDDGAWGVSVGAKLFPSEAEARAAAEAAGPREHWPDLEILTVDQWLDKYRAPYRHEMVEKLQK